MNFTPKMENVSDQKKKYPPVTKYMTEKLVTFTPEQSMAEVIKAMLETKISGAPVLNEKGEMIGVISEMDCLKVILSSTYYNQPIGLGKVADYMTVGVKTIHHQKDIIDAADLFLKSNVRRFPVVDDHGKVIGQISRRDVLRAAKDIDATTW